MNPHSISLQAANDTRYSRSSPAPRLRTPHRRPAGSVVPWTDERARLPEITGDEEIVRRTLGGIDAWAYTFLWHCVVSF